ncbi:MAG: putative nucleic-acid-binding Zn-ribbon protein [Candidatus Krumholzibacteriia bacterium]|jgi:predicted nucleic-acid-binding Zn-ribbon protein
MQQIYSCPKCNNTTFDTSEMRATGGFFSKIFNVQTKRFATVTCRSCLYTELYRRDSSQAGNVFDFLAD